MKVAQAAFVATLESQKKQASTLAFWNLKIHTLQKAQVNKQKLDKLPFILCRLF